MTKKYEKFFDGKYREARIARFQARNDTSKARARKRVRRRLEREGRRNARD